MKLILTAVVAGVLGTLAMDLLNLVFARAGVLAKIDVAMIGRMAAGWIRGRFRYGNPGEIKPVERESALGYLTHYSIGIALAVPFVLGWDVLMETPVSPGWALAYGLATTVASNFLVLPSMGLGVFGRKSPEGKKIAVSSLANHLFFGLGMAAGIVLL